MDIKKTFLILITLLAFCTTCYGFEADFGYSVRVGIVDSGIDGEIVKVADGYNFLDGSGDVTDNKGHGTKIAEIVSGVAPRAELIALKCTEKDKTTDNSAIIKAIYDGADKFGCDVLNISIGMPHSEELQKAIDYATQKGVIIVSAVGNDGEISYKKGKIYYPAGYQNAVGVGAVDEQGVVCGYSQKNESVFITTESLEGTSFAAAKITGAAAIAKSFDKRISPPLFMEFLKKAATDKGDERFDTSYGNGVFDSQSFEKIMIDRYKIIATEENDGVVTICNLSNEDISAKVFLYGDTIKSEDLVLKPEEKAVFDIKNISRCFIWQKSIYDIVWIKGGK